MQSTRKLRTKYARYFKKLPVPYSDVRKKISVRKYHENSLKFRKVYGKVSAEKKIKMSREPEKKTLKNKCRTTEKSPKCQKSIKSAPSA